VNKISHEVGIQNLDNILSENHYCWVKLGQHIMGLGLRLCKELGLGFSFGGTDCKGEKIHFYDTSMATTLHDFLLGI